jgi:hypothetical protein
MSKAKATHMGILSGLIRKLLSEDRTNTLYPLRALYLIGRIRRERMLIRSM